MFLPTFICKHYNTIKQTIAFTYIKTFNGLALYESKNHCFEGKTEVFVMDY